MPVIIDQLDLVDTATPAAPPAAGPSARPIDVRRELHACLTVAAHRAARLLAD